MTRLRAHIIVTSGLADIAQHEINHHNHHHNEHYSETDANGDEVREFPAGEVSFPVAA